MESNLFNTNYENAVIGTVILDNVLFEDIQFLDEAIFTNDYIRNIFRAMKKLQKEKELIAPLSVASKLEGDNTKHLVNITKLSSYSVPINEFEYYIKQLIELKEKRSLLEATQRLQLMLQSGSNINTCLNEFERLTSENTASYDDDKNSIGDIMSILFNEIDNNLPVTKMKTGIDIIDSLTGGIDKGELLTIGAKSGVGKTALALRIAINILGYEAKKTKIKKSKKILIISREMSKEHIAKRILSALTGISKKRIDTKELSSEEYRQLIEIMDYLNGDRNSNNLIIDDKSSTIADIKRALKKHKPDLLIVDYVQLLTPSNSKDTRERQVAEISRELKSITLDYELAVIQLTQLSDKGIGNYRPTGETACRESRAIYHDSNQMVYVHKVTEETEIEKIYKNLNDEMTENVFKALIKQRAQRGIYLVEIILDKNRDGRTASKYYWFDGQSLKYTPVNKMD